MSFEGISSGFARDLMWLHLSPTPRIVYIQVGENEVSYMDVDDVIMGILTLCQHLLNSGVEFVFVGALVPRRRPRNLTISQYRRRMESINRQLALVTVHMPRVYCKSKRGFRLSYQSMDGVHLNFYGQRWLVRHIIVSEN
ncbi:hypothetical protein ACJMK2_013500 [Sinanodonta woodiana]|uniref:SGNH hydrolase-type esterase domain-containing protein n=1 Tax=Sinanodonta woodiana TaxID=1069815 RepID=A0ABD3V0S9_SINWO